MTLIALEGVDGSGKSTLAQKIVDQLRLKYPHDDVELLHSGPLDEPPLDAYVHSLSGYQPGEGLHLVMDRWHYGEQVYGPIYRGKSAFTLAQWRWTDLFLRSRGMEVVIVTNTLEEIERRLKARGEDFLQPEHVAQVIDGFNQFTKMPTYSRTVTVGDETNMDELTNRIISNAVVAEVHAADILSTSQSYVGPLVADRLLVGERRGGQPPFVSEGAFMPYHNNSADYLWNVLTDEQWRTTGVINAKEEFDLETLLYRLSPLQVVALGKEADKVLTSHDIQHGTAPHPQWVRRFKNKQQETYAQVINDAALFQEDRTQWPK